MRYGAPTMVRPSGLPTSRSVLLSDLYGFEPFVDQVAKPSGTDWTPVFQAAANSGRVYRLRSNTQYRFETGGVLATTSGFGLRGDRSASIYMPASVFSNTNMNAVDGTDCAAISVRGSLANNGAPITDLHFSGFAIESEVSDGRNLTGISFRNAHRVSAEGIEIKNFPVGVGIRYNSVMVGRFNGNYIHDFTDDTNWGGSNPQGGGIEGDSARLSMTGTLSSATSTTAVLNAEPLYPIKVGQLFIIAGTIFGTVSGYNPVTHTVTVPDWLDVNGASTTDPTGNESWSAAVNSDDISINDNVIHDLVPGSTNFANHRNQYDGINVQTIGENSLNIIGNHIDNIGEGVDCFNHYANIKDNSIFRTFTFGIKLPHSASYCSVAGNIIVFTGKAGLYIGSGGWNDSANNLLANNIVRKVDYLGYWGTGVTINQTGYWGTSGANGQDTSTACVLIEDAGNFDSVGTILEGNYLDGTGATYTIIASASACYIEGNNRLITGSSGIITGAGAIKRYETGDVTLTYLVGGIETGVTYTARDGSYTKVGNRVLGSAYIQVNSNGANSGAVTFGGLPYASANNGSFSPVTCKVSACSLSANNDVQAVINPNSSVITFTMVNAGVQNSLNDTHFPDGAIVMVTFNYEAAS